METAPHTGNMLREYVKKHRIFQSGWARQQGVSEQTIARYLKQPTMRIDTLYTICQTLNHNFLHEIATTLPATMPPQQPPSQQAEVAALQQQVTALQTQVATLERALTLVGGRGLTS
jgi:DNA-binding Xre family transcriptional regulator